MYQQKQQTMKKSILLAFGFFLYFWFFALNFSFIAYMGGSGKFIDAIQFILNTAWMLPVCILALIASLATTASLTDFD